MYTFTKNGLNITPNRSNMCEEINQLKILIENLTQKVEDLEKKMKDKNKDSNLDILSNINFSEITNKEFQEQKKYNPENLNKSKETLSVKVYPYIVNEFKEFCNNYYPADTFSTVITGLIIFAIKDAENSSIKP